MADTLTMDEVDAAHDPFGVVAGDSAPNRCENCGKAVEYSGRGRKPKWCPDCRPARTASSDNVGKLKNVGVAKKIQDSINAMGGMTALLIAARNPDDAHILTEKIPPFATAMGQWGAENSKVRKLVENGANGFAAITVMITLFDLVWALLANHDMVPHPKRRAPEESEGVIPLRKEGSNYAG